jgi:hypothetical protein
VLRGTQVAPGAEGMQAQGECQMWLWPPLAGAGVPGAGVPGAGVPGAGVPGLLAAGGRAGAGAAGLLPAFDAFCGKADASFRGAPVNFTCRNWVTEVRRSILLVEIG